MSSSGSGEPRRTPLPQDMQAALKVLADFEKRGGNVVIDKTLAIINWEKDFDPVNVNLANLPKFNAYYDYLSRVRDSVEHVLNNDNARKLREWLSECKTKPETIKITRHGVVKEVTRDCPCRDEEQETSRQFMSAGFARDALEEHDELEGISYTLEQTLVKIRNYILPTLAADDAFFTGDGAENRDRRAVVRQQQLDQIKVERQRMVKIAEENQRLKKELATSQGKKANGKKGSGKKGVNKLVGEPSSGGSTKQVAR